MDLAVSSLKRAKEARLEVHLDMDSIFPGFLDIIAPYLGNIKALRFSQLTAIEDLTRTLPNFPQSMPNLRSLELVDSGDRPNWDPSLDPFEPFSDTLREISLYDIPLYPSFLKPRTLTELTLEYGKTPLPLGALLDYLEESHSLKRVDISIYFMDTTLPIPQRRATITNRLQHLSITCWDARVSQTLVSSIPLQRGAHLAISSYDGDGLRLKDILSGISMTHLPNLLSPTFMKYEPFAQEIQLIGPNGSFLYDTHHYSKMGAFVDFLILPLTNVQEFHLAYAKSPITFDPQLFPSLQTLVIENIDRPHLFFTLLSNPSSFPSLNTLAFLGCYIAEGSGFMEELVRFASGRKNTTSARLHRVVMVQDTGDSPDVDSIRELEKHVPVVEVLFGSELPTGIVTSWAS